MAFRVIRLIEPSACLTCRFVSLADVEFSDKSKKRMIHCKRLDCDNWETVEGSAPKKSESAVDLEGLYGRSRDM